MQYWKDHRLTSMAHRPTSAKVKEAKERGRTYYIIFQFCHLSDKNKIQYMKCHMSPMVEGYCQLQISQRIIITSTPRHLAFIADTSALQSTNMTCGEHW